MVLDRTLTTLELPLRGAIQKTNFAPNHLILGQRERNGMEEERREIVAGRWSRRHIFSAHLAPLNGLKKRDERLSYDEGRRR